MMFTLLGFFSQETFWNFFPDIPLDAYSLNIFEDFLFTRVSWGLQSISQSFEGLLTLLFGIGPSAYGSIVGLEGGGGFKGFNQYHKNICCYKLLTISSVIFFASANNIKVLSL